jgi:hypothetical protein
MTAALVVMTMTMGQLVSQLFDKYERRYHDERLAAIATSAAIEEILRTSDERVSERVRSDVE